MKFTSDPTTSTSVKETEKEEVVTPQGPPVINNIKVNKLEEKVEPQRIVQQKRQRRQKNHDSISREEVDLNQVKPTVAKNLLNILSLEIQGCSCPESQVRGQIIIQGDFLWQNAFPSVPHF